MGAGAPERQRLRITVRGAVQGVGFRPFVYRLATELRLAGWVKNSAQGVFIELEGARPGLVDFLSRLDSERPARSFIQSLEPTWLDAVGHASFEVRASDAGGEKTALVLPDIATCPDCRREIFDPGNRRFQYPFTNCTNCGPRFTIIKALPYDRSNTSMAEFILCAQCQAEYENPLDRRFHAQPNACPQCGPFLELWDSEGKVISDHARALLDAVEAIRQGSIVAVKGLGGFHLMVAASNDASVTLLRQRKHREEKPFALMFPSLEQAKGQCEVDPFEERLLLSPEAPIVLLRRTRQARLSQPPLISSLVAPGNPHLGVMLPFTPLHHLLMTELGFPVVATSANLSEEPICTDEQEALERLDGIADRFLVHNRPIVRHVDDSIVRVMLGRELMLRRARGYAPLPVQCPNTAALSGTSLLAVGAHLKNSVALSLGPQVFISQHIGDLENDSALEAFKGVIKDFQNLYDRKPGAVAADLHPDYFSTQFATQSGLPVFSVQHHLAHVLSCMAENELQPPVLGVSWDGTGYGLDGTIWGGEFLAVTERTYRRVAHFIPFPLPGGDRAVREPCRVALAMLYQVLGEAAFGMKDLAPVRAFSPNELPILKTMLDRRLNVPLTSSAGRLFDAVASLVGLRQRAQFEGQGAMELEFALDGFETADRYEIEIRDHPSAHESSARRLDWAPLVKGVLRDLSNLTPTGLISAKFHNTLVEAIVEVSERIGESKVIVTGGCFQNRYLTERTVHRLREQGFQPYWHQRVPPNDGGIALGQIVGARREMINNPPRLRFNLPSVKESA